MSVNRFATGHMKRNANPNAAAIYQITCDHTASDETMGAMKRIGSFSVRVEKMKRSAIIQCRRCQRFAHTATMCAHACRCVQCTNVIQEVGCCPRAKNKNIPLGCVNCKAADLPHSGHTANDIRNCQFYQKISAAKSKSSNTTPINTTVPVLNAKSGSSGRTATVTTAPASNARVQIQNDRTPRRSNDLIESTRANDHIPRHSTTAANSLAGSTTGPSTKSSKKKSGSRTSRSNVHATAIASTSVGLGNSAPDSGVISGKSNINLPPNALGDIVSAIAQLLAKLQLCLTP